VRPKGPKRGVGFMRRGAASLPPHQLGVWGSAVSSPSGVRGEVPAEIDFCVFLIPQKASSTTIFVHNRNVTSTQILGQKGWTDWDAVLAWTKRRGYNMQKESRRYTFRLDLVLYSDLSS